jgi:Leucine-rich repeat (LRR) protein
MNVLIKMLHNYCKHSCKAFYLLTIGVVFLNSKITAQTNLLDSLALDTIKTYTSIEEASKHPEQVIKLVLKRYKLQTIPQEVFKFTNLQYLDVSKNNILEIPDDIAILKNLQYLNLSKNKIEKLPPEIGTLHYLKNLQIGQNEIYSLPNEIGSLEQLIILDAWSNNLGTFPESLSNLKNLKMFDLRDIIISDKEKKRIQSLLPKTKIYFANGCACLN